MNTQSLTFAAVLASICSVFAHSPEAFRLEIGVLAFFIAVDTLSGFWTALVCREASSHKMRTKLISKAVQYAIFVSLCAGASVLMGTWTIINWGTIGLICIEVQSMLENLAKLQEHGGVNLGPATTIISFISRYFDATSPMEKRCDAPNKNGEGNKP